VADLSYVAMAVDMFGDGKVYETAADAQNAAGYIFSHPDLFERKNYQSL
jgi:hypothetical protein